MLTLYIRMPSRMLADEIEPGRPLNCEFALANGSAIEKEGVAALSALGGLARRARRVLLLLAPSDATLLRVKVPPLPPARLKAALPNLVEEQLMSDPADNVVVAGRADGAWRQVVAVQRDWLEKLSRTLLSLGARSIAAVPAQLGLAWEDKPAAVVAERGSDAELAVRTSELDGAGLSISADQPELLALEVLQALAALVPHGDVALYLPPGRINDYESSLHLVPSLEGRVSCRADGWSRWIAAAGAADIDVMSGVLGAGKPRTDWRRWRWPLALGAAVLLVNVLALNIDWLRQQREADALRNAMVQVYRATFPKDTVIIDPLAQMRQKMAQARRDAGELAAGDFLALAAGLGDAWRSVAPGTPLASLEYRDRGLLLKLKPETRVNMDALRNALAARNLSISQAGGGVWRVENAR